MVDTCRFCGKNITELKSEFGTDVLLMKYSVGVFELITCKPCLSFIGAIGARGAERYFKKAFEGAELVETIQ